MQHLGMFLKPPQNLNTTLRWALFSGPIQYHRILPWFFSTTETISEIMDMDWEAEWDGLGDNEPWVTEMYLAGSTQKVVQDFRKWWNRYGSGGLKPTPVHTPVSVILVPNRGFPLGAASQARALPAL